jgi:hypothetical protein
LYGKIAAEVVGHGVLLICGRNKNTQTTTSFLNVSGSECNIDKWAEASGPFCVFCVFLWLILRTRQYRLWKFSDLLCVFFAFPFASFAASREIVFESLAMEKSA